MLTIRKSHKFDLEIKDIASDKSISHRCAIFSLLRDKTSHIKNFLQGEDTLNSLKITKSLGAKVISVQEFQTEAFHHQSGTSSGVRHENEKKISSRDAKDINNWLSQELGL